MVVSVSPCDRCSARNLTLDLGYLGTPGCLVIDLGDVINRDFCFFFRVSVIGCLGC